jgi:hypothetical protein
MKLHIRPFSGEGDDFQRWKRDFTGEMRAKGLAFLLKDDATKDAYIRANQITTEEVADMNETLYYLICFSVPSDISMCLELYHEEDGVACWKYLKREFAGPARVRELQQRLRQLTLASCNNMQHYCDQFVFLMVEMKLIEGGMSDFDLLMVLMDGLPPEYDDWEKLQYGKYSPHKSFDVMDVVGILREIDKVSREKAAKENSRQDMEENQHKEIICWRCGQEGHKARVCKFK